VGVPFLPLHNKPRVLAQGKREGCYNHGDVLVDDDDNDDDRCRDDDDDD